MFRLIMNYFITAFFSLSCFLNNIWFVISICWIMTDELLLYIMFKDYGRLIYNLANRLAAKNILYVKIFQALALNHNMINNEINNGLLKFTDNVPWTNADVDVQTLIDLEREYNIAILNDYKPINSGMISLVFKGIYRVGVGETVIIKMKRVNIENNLNDGIQKLLFCVKLLSFLPVYNYQITNIIQNNIALIKNQTNFNKEVENMTIMKNNCKNLRYIKIPTVQSDVTNKFSNIIIMEYIKGETLQRVNPCDYNEFSKQIIKFVFVNMLMNGQCHGDLHVGNILFIKSETFSIVSTSIKNKKLIN